jgi:hypothetical protein
MEKMRSLHRRLSRLSIMKVTLTLFWPNPFALGSLGLDLPSGLIAVHIVRGLHGAMVHMFSSVASSRFCPWMEDHNFISEDYSEKDYITVIIL